MTTSCGSSGPSATSWQSKAMPIRRGARPFAVQPRDRAVIIAGAIADAVAARVEGGERHQHDLGVEHSASAPGPAVPKPMSTSAAPRTSSRKTIVVLSRMAGRQSRAPFSRRANISGRTSTSERIGQKPETTAPGSIDSRRGARPSPARPRCARRVERVAPGERFAAQCPFRVPDRECHGVRHRRRNRSWPDDYTHVA